MLTIVEPGWELLYPDNREGLVEFIERCGRTCYRSECRIKEGSADTFVRKICRNRHESVLEHASITVRITCSRAASHQLVRHRVGCAYSQESMRYCNYGKKGLRVICPPSIGLESGRYTLNEHGVWKHENVPIKGYKKHCWLNAVDTCYQTYLDGLDDGLPPEDARFILPNATKTEVVTTFNVRMWRHVFRERALNPHAQWEIRGIFKSILDAFVVDMPAFFEDLV